MTYAPTMLAALALIAAPLGVLQEAPTPDDDPVLAAAARAALAPITEEMKDVRFLRARFVQEQESLLLDEPIVTKGALLLRAKPATLVLDVEGERPVRIRSDAKSHLVHRIAAKRAERWVFEENQIATALLACLGADVDALEKAFRARAVESLPADAEAELPARTLVRLAPRDERVASVVAELELVVDPKAKVVLEIRHSNPDGELVRLRLSKVELDPKTWKAPNEAFTDELPKGTDVRTRRVPARKAR